ncbi:MAG: thioesterase [Eubacterium sp.]|nr:thioesterase [Eubacterium sp.]
MSIKLFCIPYAGGVSEVFSKLNPFLREDIEIIPVDYAGHGPRAKEPFYQSFDEMARDTAKCLNEYLDGGKYAVFGYSMGSVVSFEMLVNKYLKYMPEHLFVASHEAPGEYWHTMEYAGLSDSEFFHKLVEFGGFKAEDEERMKNRFFKKLIFDPIKADYDLIASYELHNETPVDMNVTMMFSTNDVSREAVEKWQKRFTKPMEFIEIGKNHFFINDEYETVADIINKRV